jgi:uncharacterized protein (DUF1330 family)
MRGLHFDRQLRWEGDVFRTVFIVRGGKFEVAQGGSRGRNVVIEFPSYEAALDCWHSPEYRRASPLLMQTTQVDIIIIEGYDGPQPS